MRWALLLCMLLLPMGQAVAQDRSCQDDNGRDRCAGEAIDAQNQLYDLPSIATMANAGSYVRRAIFVDGYGNEVAAVSFVRAAGQEPRVEVRLPRAGTNAPRTISAAVSEEVWHRAIAQGSFFDRDLVPLPSADGNISVCLHSWVTRVESADPPRQSRNIIAHRIEPAVIRSRTQNSCNGDLQTHYAFELAAIAMDALPNCTLIAQESERNSVTRLRTCASLDGDRVTAAHASNMFRRLRTLVYDNRINDDWREAFSENAQIIVDGNPLAQGQASYVAFARWLEPYRLARLYGDGVIGRDADTAEANGSLLVHRKDGDGNRSGEIAAVTMRWTQRAGGMVIERIEIGPFSAR